MTFRQQQILFSIINDYIENSVPVGSESLIKKHNINVCPATIRTEMFQITRQGYLTQPYASSGRVPTSKAYRLFVDSLNLDGLKTFNLPAALRRAKTRPRKYLKNIAKYSKALVINYDNAGFLLKVGLDVLLEEPEFRNINNAKNLISDLELIDERIDYLAHRISDDKITVYIEKENPIIKVRSCSMVISSYRKENRCIIALVGPIRMRYDRNVAVVQEVANQLSYGK